MKRILVALAILALAFVAAPVVTSDDSPVLAPTAAEASIPWTCHYHSTVTAHYYAKAGRYGHGWGSIKWNYYGYGVHRVTNAYFYAPYGEPLAEGFLWYVYARCTEVTNQLP